MSNCIEKLNRKVKRRTRVVGVFPNEQSVLRIAGSVLVEEDERRRSAGMTYYSPACRELEKRSHALDRIARQQQELRKAA